VSLYIDPEVLARLEQSDPMGSLTEKNLADYCTALEGSAIFSIRRGASKAMRQYRCWSSRPRPRSTNTAATVFLIADQQAAAIRRTCIRGFSIA